MNDRPALNLVHEDSDTSGGFFLRDDDGAKLGEMTYRKQGGGKLVFHHTWVDDSLRGQGRARELLDAALVWVRATDQKIVPVCSYVTGQFKKDDSIQDVLAG